MSAIVTDILTGILAICATACSTGYQEIHFVREPQKNGERGGKLGYGARTLEADTAESITGTYNLDHKFEIVLTDTYGREDSDYKTRSALNTMYDKADEIFKRIVTTKAGAPTYVLIVNEQSISEPEYFETDNIIALRMRVNIRYRNALA